MSVGLRLGRITDEIGSSSFFHSFFSTVSYLLEKDGWGSRFPSLLKDLYQGSLQEDKATQALEELETISNELKNHPPRDVVWDIENLDSNPPWGENVSPDITDLSNYFVTSAGRDLIGVLRECLEELRDRGGVLEIVQI